MHILDSRKSQKKSKVSLIYIYNRYKYILFYSCLNNFLIYDSEYQWKPKLRLVRIYFDTPTFDRITMDKSAKFLDKLSAVGGTMGLLTGFSIISGIEIIYFSLKTILEICKKLYTKINVK